MILYYKQSYILICFSVVQGFLLLLFVHLCVFFLKDTLERQKLLPYKVLFFFLNYYLFIYLFILFLAVLGLRFCVRASSSCGKRGPLFIAVRGPHYRGLSLWSTGSRAQAQQLWLTGLAALWHVGSSQTRARTRVPCISRQILNHCATSEALICFFTVQKFSFFKWSNILSFKISSFGIMQCQTLMH